MHLLPALVVLAFCVATSGQLGAASLSDALTEAYLNNADLAAQRRALRATDAQIDEARAGYLPTLSGSLEYQVTRGKADSAFDFPSVPGQDLDPYEELVESEDAETKTATLTLNQNIYKGGATSAAMARARSLVLSGRAQLRSTEQTVLLDAVSAYVSTWRDRGILDYTQRNLDGFRRQFADTRERFALGRLARTDVVQAEARVARASADLEAARGTLADSEADYENVIGRPPPLQLDDPTAILSLPTSLDEAYGLAESNPDVVRARFDLEASRSDIDTASADLRPSLDLQGQLSYSDDPNPQIVSQRTAQVGLTLTLPFYQGGAAAARLREARETRQQRESELESVSRDIRRDVRSAWEAVRSARARVDGYEEEVSANRFALDGVEQEVALGRRPTSDVLDAQQDLYNSVVNVLQARSDLLNAGYRLKASVGELDVLELGLSVEPYDLSGSGAD